MEELPELFEELAKQLRQELPLARKCVDLVQRIALGRIAGARQEAIELVNEMREAKLL